MIHTQIIMMCILRKHVVNLSLYDNIKVTEDTNILYCSAFTNKKLIFFFRRLTFVSNSNLIIQSIYFIIYSHCFIKLFPQKSRTKALDALCPTS